MVDLIRTNSENNDLISLVFELDKDLAIRDGDETTFYSQYNGIDDINFAIVAYIDSEPAGCGAIKSFNDEAMEIKRMFVLPKYRGRGFSSAILKELELWTTELDYKSCVLETGKRNPEAVKLYEKKGYRLMPNYEPYIDIENSLCFKKELR